MSDYTQVTAFTPKDSLTTGDENKKIRGSQFDVEFAAIAAAIQSKFDSVDIASDAEAAALTSDAKLITPDKLAHALQNATLTLGANILLNGGIAATDLVRKSTASTISALLSLSAATGEKLRLISADSLGDNYLTFYSSDGTTRRGYVGNGNSGDNILHVVNEVASAAIALTTSSGPIDLTASEVTINGDSLLLAGVNVAFGVGASSGGLHGSYSNSGITSITRTDVGRYTINYTAAGFTGVPVVVAGLLGSSGFVSQSGVGTSTSCTIEVLSTAGAFADRVFTVHIIGPAA